MPFYNFGVSQHVKTWVDLVIAGAGPTTPILKGTPTVLVTVRGGGYGPGTPREGWDHSTPTSGAFSPTSGRPTSPSASLSATDIRTFSIRTEDADIGHPAAIRGARGGEEGPRDTIGA